MRHLGLDVGDRTIGVAVSDELAIIAQGLETIHRQDLDKDLGHLKQIIETYEIGTIVVGLPRNMNGTIGPQAEKVKEFAETLQRCFGLPVKFWDERLTTIEAEKILLSQDVSRRKRKKVIDKMAAVVILQGYLDRSSLKS